jgi:hypothetical protein
VERTKYALLSKPSGNFYAELDNVLGMKPNVAGFSQERVNKLREKSLVE